MNIESEIHACFVSGNYDRLKKLAGDKPGFPDCVLSYAFGHTLEYAIYHSPLTFIDTLLKNGADPNYGNHNGFPSIIAALSSKHDETQVIIELLLEYGADINQRGHNDWTPLHWSAVEDDVEMIKFLLNHGADPTARTRIDDLATPLEEARISGSHNAVRILEQHA